MPDGRLVYTSAPNGTVISTLGANGRWSVPVADTTFRGFWSRDGRYRLYRQKAGLFAQRDGSPPLLVLASGALPGQLTASAVGPDPAALYVRTIDSSGVHAFYSVPIAGGKPRLILRLDDSAQRPARVIFSADARRLYFTVTQAESDVWMVDLHKRR